MITSIYFVRHGKVENPTDVLYGRLDGFGLAEEGKQQLEQTANFLQSEQIDFIYSSPLQRAKESAEIIRQKLGLPEVHISEYLNEVETSAQGQPSKYLHEHYPLFNLFVTPDNGLTGETIEQVFHRVEQFVTFITKKYGGKKVVAVSHGDILMLIKAKAEGLPTVIESIRPEEKKYVQKGEVYKLTCEDATIQSLESVFKPQI